MSDKLIEICGRTREHLAACMVRRPLAELEACLAEAPPVRGFIQALRSAAAAGRTGLIAEIKQASPSRGQIRDGFDPAGLANAYEAGGATCLSVLTDGPYFGGSLDHLVAARAAAPTLPVLRKDFTLDPYQVLEARVAGADAVLLIIAALSPSQATELMDAALRCGIDVLVEVHDAGELARALDLPCQLVGINNRNLRTLAVDLATTERLAPSVPPGRLVVCESGIHKPADIARMRAVGVSTFLVGESLLRQRDVRIAVRTLLEKERPEGSTTPKAEYESEMTVKSSLCK